MSECKQQEIYSYTVGKIAGLWLRYIGNCLLCNIIFTDALTIIIPLGTPIRDDYTINFK